MADAAPMTAAQLMQLNGAQRAAVLNNAVEMTQQIYSQQILPATQTVLNIPTRNVGLIKGFLVEVSGTLTNGATTQANRSPFGSANILSNVQFTDLNNNTRINVPGWFLAIVNSSRQGWGFGGVYANNLGMGYGNNYSVNSAPATIAANADAAVKHIYYVPLAYAGDDLRGSIYAAVVSATMNLQLTINPTPGVGALDSAAAMYRDNAGLNWKANVPVQVTVYQVYLDQLPIANGGPVVPIMDLNTVYELKQTTVTGITAGNDYPIQYANYRDFLSTFVVFDNGGVFNPGTDINYFALTSANYTNLMKYGPDIAALKARQTFMADVPTGSYFFDTRSRPLNTIAYGNMELNVNASTVNVGAKLLVGFEQFAQVNTLIGSAGSSLPAG